MNDKIKNSMGEAYGRLQGELISPLIKSTEKIMRERRLLGHEITAIEFDTFGRDTGEKP